MAEPSPIYDLEVLKLTSHQRDVLEEFLRCTEQLVQFVQMEPLHRKGTWDQLSLYHAANQRLRALLGD